MKTPSRRDLLHTIGTGLGFAVIGGLVHFLQRTHLSQYPLIRRRYAQLVGLLRPPGAIPEKDFLAACIRCYRCQDACEPGAIQFYSERDGDLYHTPYVDPTRKGCTLCLKCGPACPTGALGIVDDRTQVEMASVGINEDLCLSYKAQRIRDEQDMLMQLGHAPTDSTASDERRGPCGECYMFCPLRERAITLKPGGFLAPLIHPEHCAGCGMCEEICRQVVRGEPAIFVVRTRRPAHALQEATS